MDGKFWRENGNENFLECLVGWGGRKINCRTQVFSPQVYLKVFSPRWRENWSKNLDIIFGQKCPCVVAHELVHIDLLHFFFFFSFLSFGCCLFFFSFSFDLQGRLCTRLVLIFFFFFLLLSFMFWLGHMWFNVRNICQYFM